MRIPAPTLWLMAVLATLVMQVIKSHDWQHLLWVTMLPLMGLVATSGSMLAGGRARMAALSIAVVGLMPLLTLSARGGLDGHDVTAVESVPTAALDVVEFGFTGKTPLCMEPLPGSPELGSLNRGSDGALRSPSRDVTVPMGGLYFGSVALILLGVIVLISKFIPRGIGRTVWLSVSPLSVFLLVRLAGGVAQSEVPIWRNERWLVEAVGPLTAAAGAALILILLVADSPRDEGSGPLGD